MSGYVKFSRCVKTPGNPEIHLPSDPQQLEPSGSFWINNCVAAVLFTGRMTWREKVRTLTASQKGALIDALTGTAEDPLKTAPFF